MSKRGACNYAYIAIALVLFAYITIQIEISQIFNFIAPSLPEQIAVFQPNTQSTSSFLSSPPLRRTANRNITDFPEGWLDCGKIKEVKSSESQTFYRKGYKFPVYNYDGLRLVIKGLNHRHYDTYKVSKIARSINAYNILTDHGRETIPGIPKFRGSCLEGSWWGMVMDYLENTFVLCEDRKAFGDREECESDPNKVYEGMRNSSNPNGFILNFTRSLLTLTWNFRRKGAFLEDFTATNFVFDPEGNVYVVDFDSIMFQENEVGFLAGTGCLEHSECPEPKGWTLTHGLAKATLGKCQEMYGNCNNDTRICQGFSAHWMLCGFSNWFFRKFESQIGCDAYTKMAECSSKKDPTQRCSSKEALDMIQSCEAGKTSANEIPLQIIENENTDPRAVVEKEVSNPVISKKGPFEPAAEDCGSDVPNVGYQPYRNYERWNPMRDFLNSHNIRPETAIDFGSNTGFFSMKLASCFDTQIFAFDTNEWYKGEYPQSHHLKVVEELGIREKHRFCQGSWHQRMIDELYNTNMRLDVQVVLSIFHWLRIKSVESANEYLKKMFLSSTVTFLELPKVGSRVMSKMKYWFGDRESVEEIVGDVISEMQAEGYAVETKYLATTIITDQKYNSPRELFAIVVDIDTKEQISFEALWQIFKCKQIERDPPPPADPSKTK